VCVCIGAHDTLCNQAWRVWKTIVPNTPRTLKRIFSALMDIIIADLASSDLERQQVRVVSNGRVNAPLHLSNSASTLSDPL